MAKSELSVIIPSFGRAESLQTAVMSALSQAVDLEVIVIDDGSPQTLSVDADERVRIVRLSANKGPAAARNAGAAVASADWLAFLDSDDVWVAGSLAPRFNAARAGANPESTIWCAGFVNVWPSGAEGNLRVPRAAADARLFASGCWCCPGSTALLSRAAWARSGGQDETLRRLEDYDWLFRWGVNGGVLATFDGGAAKVARGRRAPAALVQASASAILRKHESAPAALKRRMQSYLALELAASRLHEGNTFGGVAALAQSWILHPRLQPALEPFWGGGNS